MEDLVERVEAILQEEEETEVSGDCSCHWVFWNYICTRMQLKVLAPFILYIG